MRVGGVGAAGTIGSAALAGGKFFGDNGDGFLRVNIGCPRRYLTEGILRLKQALGV